MSAQNFSKKKKTHKKKPNTQTKTTNPPTNRELYTNLHSWPVHPHQCLLLWSFHPPLHQSTSHQGLSSHGAAQQHWCSHSHPEKSGQSVSSPSYKLQCICTLERLDAFTLSKTRNASLISSSLSVSFIFLAIMVRNSGKSIVPFPEKKFLRSSTFELLTSSTVTVNCWKPLRFDRVLTISIHFIDHVLQFCLCGILAQRAHDCAQLFGCDGAISILVKEWEGLLEF